MASILKKKLNNKGFIVFTHKEKNFFIKRYLNFFLQKDLLNLKKNYVIGMHWGWFKENEVDIPFIDFHLAAQGTLSFQNPKNNTILNLCNRNFIDKIYKKKNYTKIFDLICISRPVNFKKNRELFIAANKIYNLGYKYRMLLIFPMPSEKLFQKHDHYYHELINDYNSLIAKQYRKYFTLIPIYTFDHQYVFSKEEICDFLNLSKAFILPVEREGASRVIHEALVCGLPIIAYKNIQGGGGDLLDSNNSIFFDDYENMHKQIIFMLENLSKFKYDESKYVRICSEEYQIPVLKEYLKKIYLEQEGFFKDENYFEFEDLDRKLDSHEITLPQNMRKKISNKKNLSGLMSSNDIASLVGFYRFLCFCNEVKTSYIKILFLYIFESIFNSLRYIKKKYNNI
jgi:hypothetical protein